LPATLAVPIRQSAVTEGRLLMLPIQGPGRGLAKAIQPVHILGTLADIPLRIQTPAQCNLPFATDKHNDSDCGSNSQDPRFCVVFLSSKTFDSAPLDRIFFWQGDGSVEFRSWKALHPMRSFESVDDVFEHKLRLLLIQFVAIVRFERSKRTTAIF
jgi:hypothetical protein